MPSRKKTAHQPSSHKNTAAQPLWAGFVAALVLAGSVWAVYGRGIDTPLGMDDWEAIPKNSSIKSLWPLWGDASRPGPLAPYAELPTAGRPLVNLTLAINYHFGQENPRGYHAVNFVIHILSALVLMGIVRQTLQLPYFRGRFDRVAWPLSFAAALLWALHPLHTEAVMYITQRTELMMGFSYLATLYASLRYWAAPSPRGRTTWLAVATLACLAGMACKEVMVTAPVIVLLFERTFIAGSFSRALQRSWKLYAGLAMGWLFLLWLNSSGPRARTAGFNLGLPAYAWWFTQAKVLLMYLKLAVWPWPLGIRYDMPFIATIGLAWQYLLSVAMLAVATLVLVWRNTSVGFVAASVFIILSPTLVVPIITEVAAERRMYLPLAGLVTAFTVGGYVLVMRAAEAWSSRDKQSSPAWWNVVAPSVIAVMLAAVFVLVGVRRVAAFEDEVARCNEFEVGAKLLQDGKPREAIPHFERTVQLKPDFTEANYNLGTAWVHAGQPDRAVPYFQKALERRPHYAEGRFDLGDALLQTGQLPQAAIQFQRAAYLKPDYAEAYFGLANAYAKMNQRVQSIEAAKHAMELATAQRNPAFARHIEAWLASQSAARGPE